MTDLIEREPETAQIEDAPCACGSGLRRRSCCGLDLRQVRPVDPEGPFAETLSALTRAYRMRDFEVVRGLAIEVLEQAPGQREALGALFNLLKDEGRHEAAAAVIDRMAAVNQNDAMARMLAARFFLARGDVARAQFHGRMLVRLAPEEPLAHHAMGQVFLRLTRMKAAEHHFRLALALPGLSDGAVALELQANLAMALQGQGQFDEARAIFVRLEGLKGRETALLLGWAEMEEAAREFDAAARLLDEVIAHEPGNLQARMRRAALHRRVKDDAAALAALDAIASEEAAEADSVGVLLQKGQVLDSLGHYDEAFAAFEAFKQRQRALSGISYQAEQAATLATNLTQFFTPGRDPLMPRAERRAESPQPIFVVGFPRSGTTLIEQTLTAHPQIAAGDELPIVNAIADRAQMLLGSPLAYPMALSELWLGDRVGHIATLRDSYLNDAAQMGAIDPTKRWFTDKMPLNETHLGLIHLMFPQSPIVHLVRHPLDVVLSVFSNGLTHGFFCAYALESAAQHYALIADLIAHYRAVLPLRYHAVRYEELVTDQERVVRGLFDFLAEPFDPATLAFHENARPARTASYAQVTEKLYDRSRYRYRNYRKQLEPVIPILRPVIERLGYTIED